MESNYKNKYLKYKNKYLELKSQNGGLLTDNIKLELQTDTCIIYIQKLIVNVEPIIDCISHNLVYIKNIAENKNVMAQEILSNMLNINKIRVFVMNTSIDGYKKKDFSTELLYFDKIVNENYMINSKTGKKIKSTLLNSKILQLYSNSLIGINTPEGGRWIYVDDQLIIHNPYYYNMKSNFSQNLCQFYALLMALLPSMRKPCIDVVNHLITQEKNERLCAYKSLLNLLSIILYPIIYYVLINDNYLHNDIIRYIRDTKVLDIFSKNTYEYREFINSFLKEFINDLTKTPEINAQRISNVILTILNTSYALELEKAPEFQ